jgi:hypothetical protein
LFWHLYSFEIGRYSHKVSEKVKRNEEISCRTGALVTATSPSPSSTHFTPPPPRGVTRPPPPLPPRRLPAAMEHGSGEAGAPTAAEVPAAAGGAGVVKAKSCKGCLYFSSVLRSRGRGPVCAGVTRAIPEGRISHSSPPPPPFSS